MTNPWIWTSIRSRLLSRSACWRTSHTKIGTTSRAPLSYTVRRRIRIGLALVGSLEREEGQVITLELDSMELGAVLRGLGHYDAHLLRAQRRASRGGSSKYRPSEIAMARGDVRTAFEKCRKAAEEWKAKKDA